MTLFIDKMKEVSKTLLPVVLFVLFISLTTVSVPSDIVIRFLIGSVILLVGLTIFLWGHSHGTHRRTYGQRSWVFKKPNQNLILKFFIRLSDYSRRAGFAHLREPDPRCLK